jgi:hypothetical protein
MLDMKKYFYNLVVVASLFLVSQTSLKAQNQLYFAEGFEPDNGTTLGTVAPTATTPYYFDGVMGMYGVATRWYGSGIYRTTGTACGSYGLNHIRYKNISGVTDSGFIVTPIVDNGIKEFHFTRARASRYFTVWKTSDTLATTSNWTMVASIPSFTTTCVDSMILVNDVTARRIKLVGRLGTDSDVDSLSVTSFNLIAPVKFGSINASISNGLVKISWNVLAEINTDKYYVERSADGRTFVEVGSLTAIKSDKYSLVDNAPTLIATSYYRIKAIDKDGTVGYSSIMKLASKKAEASISVYPNPVTNGVMNLQISNFAIANYTVFVFDVTGKNVFSKVLNVESGSSNISIELPYGIQKGMYQVQLTDGSLKLNKSVIIQ